VRAPFVCESRGLHFLVPLPRTFYSKWLRDADSDFYSAQISELEIAQHEWP
jgi:hypothetical protein